jgi:diaminohydroxyphosphoribosylaminopyrimidine deaminase/5-amino-6-(5-phosphoribosylamino)uracil reductase
MVEAADREFMRLALFHAARGRGRTSPNPMVGCVVVSPDGVIVGSGYHARAGEPHAEVRALSAAGARARGATLYCTLEPCCHQGRTGPCVVPIVEAGVRRVVAAVSDPNPLVSGRGLAFLRQRGIEVVAGVLEEDAAALNRAFFTAVTLGRPHVTMKVATSLDARVAARRGARTALSSRESSRRVQLLRAEMDAIAVGSETVLVDDPLLTVRTVFRERPFLRAVFDRRLRVPPSARVFTTLREGPVVVFTSAASAGTAAARVAAVQAAGAEVVATPSGEIGEALRVLAEREVRSVLLEGGPTLHRAAWQAGCVDRVTAIVAPQVLGREGVQWSLPGDFSLAGLEHRLVVPLGPDVLIEGDVHRTH